MKSKKAFTLIELLAVIVILAIILSIAITSVTKIIADTKIDISVKNEKIFLEAAKKFMVNNSDKFPINIGDTTEISLNELKSQNYMDNIKSPYGNNNCNGYILVNKTGNNTFDYSTNLNCSSDTITSSSDDKLVAYYKFDDFQEPTQNLLKTNQISVELGNKNDWADGISNFSWGVSNYIATEEEAYDGKFSMKATTSGTRASEGIGMYTIPCEANTLYTISMYVKIPLNKSFRLVIGTTISSVVDTLGTADVIGTGNWQRITLTTNKTRDVPYDLRWTLINQAAESISYYVDAVQFEKKSYATPFTTVERFGTIINHSGNSIDQSLSLTTTPKWVNNSKTGNGAYQFSKSTDLISVNGVLNNIFPNQKYSWGAWIKLDNSFSSTGRILMSQSNVLELTVTYERKVTATTKDSVGYKITPSSSILDLNKWYHVFSTCDGINTKLYIDGKYVSQITSNGFTNPSNNVYIGNWSSNQVFKGIIDDVRIYSRDLSESEVEAIYNRGNI